MWRAAQLQTSTHPTHSPVPPTANQSLAKHNRKPLQLTENNHQRPKSIASFCRNLSAPPPHPTNHDSRGTYHAFLISSRPGLEIELTRSQQTRKRFLISSFFAVSPSASHPTNCHRDFLTATDRIQKIGNPVKTEEKQFSNRNMKTHRGTGNLACAPCSALEFRSDNTIQHQRAQARLPVPLVVRVTTYQSPITTQSTNAACLGLLVVLTCPAAWGQIGWSARAETSAMATGA